ncbi:hypothetical protein SMICM17S_01215 [Streptomyces microflavus]
MEVRMTARFSRTTLVSALIVATALALVAMGLTAITNAGATAPDSAAAPPAAASTSSRGTRWRRPNPWPSVTTPTETGTSRRTRRSPVWSRPRRYSRTATSHEFQANCSVTHTAPDDPIVYPGRAGASDDHTFMGNRTTNASSTTASLGAGRLAWRRVTAPRTG